MRKGLIPLINLTYPSNLPSELQGVQIVDVRESLPVNPMYTWAQLARIRPITELTTIVFHHDAISKQSTMQYTDIQLATRIATAHINSKKNHANGDAGFPYDIWVRNGILYLTNHVEVLEYGVGNNNAYTVNVCVSGDYANYDTLTDADRKALYVAYFLLKPVLPSYKELKGHKEITATACPGYDMFKVRSDIAAIEEQMVYTESPANLNAELYATTLRYNDLWAKFLNKDGKWSKEIQAESGRKLNRVNVILRAEGWVK
jgi:hypothetical protein